MDGNDGAVQHARKLLVYVHDVPVYVSQALMDRMAQNDTLQLVHEHRLRAPRAGPMDRLLIRAGLKDLQKSALDKAVSQAHTFITSKYQKGDQIVILVDTSDSAYPRRAAEILARHLYDGTRPDEPSKVPNIGIDTAGPRIPIHCICIVGEVGLSIDSSPKFYDDLKFSFPPGIERIIFLVRSADVGWTYSTTLDAGGAVVSKEIHLTSGYLIHNLVMIRDGLVHATQDVIHYKSQYVPRWNQETPVWTQALKSSPRLSSNRVAGIHASESEMLLGMYRHELRKYPDQHTLKMVWKSSRH